MNIFDRTVEVVKNIVGENINPGDVAIDATMGNGNDTLLLAKLVGEEGRVYSFDVQDTAIESTMKLLDKNDMLNVTLIKSGHENMKTYVKENVNCVMFNLGYLPNGDKSISTLKDSTMKAISKSLELLNINGLLTVVSYYGHENGKSEKIAVDEFMKKLDNKLYKVIKLESYNGKDNPPIIYAVKKIK